jgi:hypothetical protein
MRYEVLIVTDSNSMIYFLNDVQLLNFIQTSEAVWFECIKLATRQTLQIRNGEVLWKDIPQI